MSKLLTYTALATAVTEFDRLVAGTDALHEAFISLMTMSSEEASANSPTLLTATVLGEEAIRAFRTKLDDMPRQATFHGQYQPAVDNLASDCDRLLSAVMELKTILRNQQAAPERLDGESSGHGSSTFTIPLDTYPTLH